MVGSVRQLWHTVYVGKSADTMKGSDMEHRPTITQPVPPLCYGSDGYYNAYWHRKYESLLLMAMAVQADRDELVKQVQALSSELMNALPD
jgi:hypothetical protein